MTILKVPHPSAVLMPDHSAVVEGVPCMGMAEHVLVFPKCPDLPIGCVQYESSAEVIILPFKPSLSVRAGPRRPVLCLLLSGAFRPYQSV